MSYLPQPYGAPPPAGGPQPAHAAPLPSLRLRGRIPRMLGWIFLAVAVVLFVIGGIVLATQSFGKVDGFQRVSLADGGGWVKLDGTGKWIVYYEASDVSDSTTRIPPIDLKITDTSGDLVPFVGYGDRSDGKVDKFTYDNSGHHGIAAAQFTITTTGSYQLDAHALASVPDDADLAVGRDISTGTVAGGLLIVGGVLSLIAAIVLLIVGFVQRGRHRRALDVAAYYASQGYAPPGYGPTGYGPTGYAPPGYGPTGYGPTGYGPPGYGSPDGPDQPPPPPYNPPPVDWGPPSGPPVT